MWAGISDTQLVKQSDLIVQATYLGSTSITLNKKKLQLGVLQIEDTLKGEQQEVILIHTTSTPKGFPQRSDTISFKVGQKGLWILQRSSQQGIYEIKIPQAFISESRLKDRLPQLLPFIEK